jgi:hypothetical protein
MWMKRSLNNNIYKINLKCVLLSGQPRAPTAFSVIYFRQWEYRISLLITQVEVKE